MHSVLDLESDWTVTQDDEALEERPGETRPCGFVIRYDGAQLLMVANEDYLSASKDQGDHTFCERASESESPWYKGVTNLAQWLG